MQMILISLLFLVTNTCGVEMISGPQSVNVSQGSQAMFQCAASAASDISWFINGSSIKLLPYSLQSTLSQQHDVLYSNLSFAAIELFNETIIKCLAVPSGEGSTVSSSAVLLIQGPLSGVGSYIAQVTNSSLYISYAPYTISNVPITGYNITLYAVLSDSYYTYWTSAHNYSIDLPSVCDNYKIYVTPINGAGDGVRRGKILSLLESSEIYDSTSPSLEKTDSLIRANISLNVSHDCNAYITHTININNDDIMTTLGPYTILDDYTVLEVTLDQLLDNTHYNVDIWDSTEGGASNTVNIIFSTYGTQDIVISSTPHSPTCITCYFMMGARETGCYVRLSNSNYGNTDIHVTRRDGDDSVTGCISSITPGYYNALVYDIEDTGMISADPALTISDVMIFMSGDSITDDVMPSATASVLRPTSSVTMTTEQSIAVYRNAAIGVGVVVVILIEVVHDTSYIT